MSAVIVGVYRYHLERSGFPFTPGGPTVCVLMVNPSTADAELNDPTIVRLCGFAGVHRWGKFVVGNKFALRSTDVRALAGAPDPVGPLNDTFLRAMMFEADVLIAAWGSLAKLPFRLQSRWCQVVALAHEANKPLWCFGTCGDGHPRHPLMLPYTTPLVKWRPPC